jgi:hypothetical protein
MFNTKVREIELKQVYPGIFGEMGQPSSKASKAGVDQQFLDRGMQKEIGLHRTTIGQNVSGDYLFAWTLTFYVHPGMRKEVPIEAEDLPQLVDYLHALAVGVAPMNELDRRLNDWCRFHTFGFGGSFETGKDVLKYLKHAHFPWNVVEKNLEPYGVKTFKVTP